MRILLLLLCLSILNAKEKIPSDFTVTNHTIQLANGPLEYTAVTGFCPVKAYDGSKAELFFISYTKNGDEPRPITFVFPGGPGGAGTIESIFTFGPRRLLTAGEGRTILPPYKIIDNPETLLEKTDLVFVDPVNCGFSKADKKATPKQ